MKILKNIISLGNGILIKPKCKVLIVLLLSILLLLIACSRSIDNKAHVTKKIPSKVPVVTGIHRFKRIIINSKILNKAMKVNVYLPKGYKEKNKYPVLYILPGSTGEQNFCIPGLKMDETTDKLIMSNKINPLIIISPETDNSFGLNSSNNHIEFNLSGKIIQLGRYEDYLSNELVKFVDSHYSTITNRNGRYIGGMSDGGYIALHTAFLHSDQYSKVGGHSPNILHTLPNKQIENLYFKGNDASKTGDIFYLAQKNHISNLNIYLDCGNVDKFQFYNGCAKLYKILQVKKIKSQYHLNNGTHSAAYWKSKMDEYLIFYSGKNTK